MNGFLSLGSMSYVLWDDVLSTMRRHHAIGYTKGRME